MRRDNCELIGKVISVEETPDTVELYISSSRPTGTQQDIIPVSISRDVLGDNEIKIDTRVQIHCVIKTINISGNFKTRLRAQAIDIAFPDEDVPDKNAVYGRFVVKSAKPVRTTRTGKRIKDLILYRRVVELDELSEFRAIMWNDNAEKFDNIQEGSEIYIVGNLQSRQCKKYTDKGEKEIRTYEVSIGVAEDETDIYAEEV